MIAILSSQAVAQEVLTVSPSTGGLREAIQILQARHAVSIDLEEPRHVQGVDLVQVRSSGPGARWMLRLQVFDFHYTGGADEAVRAMVAAWDAAGGAGDYRVEVVDRVYRLVPTTAHDASGRHVPWTPVLDCVIEPTRLRGTVRELWEAAGAAIAERCVRDRTPVFVAGGATPPEPEDAPPVVDYSRFERPNPDYPDQTYVDLEAMTAASVVEARAAEAREPPTIEIPPGPRPARALLDELARAAGDGGWMFAREPDHWVLTGGPVDPRYEYLFNRTPLFEAPAPPISRGPVPVE